MIACPRFPNLRREVSAELTFIQQPSGARSRKAKLVESFLGQNVPRRSLDDGSALKAAGHPVVRSFVLVIAVFEAMARGVHLQAGCQGG